MSGVTVAGHPVLGGFITLPARGAWLAQLEVATQEGITGKVEVLFGDTTMVGTVVRSGEGAGRTRVTLTPGNGCVGTVTARHMQGAAALDAARWIASSCGEGLDESCARFLSGRLDHWSIAQGTVHSAADDLAEALSLSWRMTLAGKLWVGTDTWVSVASLPELSGDGGVGYSVVAAEGFEIVPGCAVGTARVGRVEYEIGNEVRCTYWRVNG
jgi:hypothetical protein